MSRPCENCSADLRVCKDCDIHNGYIFIPDNATNGDVIKALFPNIDFHCMEIKNDFGYVAFNLDWWNAPYIIKENTDGNNST